MRARIFLPSGFGLLLLVGSLSGQIVSYSFGTSGAQTTAATFTAENLSSSIFASTLGGGVTSSSSPGSSTAGGGGGAYFTASNWRASDGNYFSFSVTPASGYAVIVTSISFYYASTSTGPSSAMLTSSVDGYAGNLGTFSLTQQAGGSLLAADWHQASSSITLTAFDTATSFRLGATGASVAGGTLRVDAVVLNGTVSAVPEPSTYAAIAGVWAVCGVLWHRRRRAAAVR